MADRHERPPKDWGPYDPIIFGEPEPPGRWPYRLLLGLAIGFAVVVPLWVVLICIFMFFTGGI